MLLGLKSRIGTAFPLQEDSFLKKRALPASFQTLAIAALWGDRISFFIQIQDRSTSRWALFCEEN
jgi:hypothetical protein